jgi:hypothetical protein
VVWACYAAAFGRRRSTTVRGGSRRCEQAYRPRRAPETAVRGSRGSR